MKNLTAALAAVLLFWSGSASAADFSGNGRDDIAVFRTATGLWAIRGVTRAYFGTAGDIPTPGRWTQNGRDEIAVFRPSSGLWAVRGGPRNYFGSANDIPLGFGGGSSLWQSFLDNVYRASGRVGIGTSTPNADLHIVSDSPGILFQRLWVHPFQKWSFNFSDGLEPDDFVLYNHNAAGTAIRVAAETNHVGIGLESRPGYRLAVRGPSNSIFPVMITNHNLLSYLYLGFGSPTGDTYANIVSGGSDLVLQQYPNQRVGIGHTNPGYTLDVAGPVWLRDMASGPSPSENSSGLYSLNGELFAMDQNGFSTQISPHDPETGEWIFYSKNVKTGRVVRVDMERMVRAIEELTGETFMVEKWEKEETL